ncbi:hypothetical protein B484DRAFT_409877, partial [Ochromonadaceae sp. CCMP2298]
MEAPGSDDEQWQACYECIPAQQISPQRHKSKDSDLKTFIREYPLMNMEGLRCNMKTCQFNGDCVSKTSLGSIIDMRNDMWGTSTDVTVNAQSRGDKIYSILKHAWRNDAFQFYVPGDKRAVCEVGFLLLVGLSTKNMVSGAPGQWKRMKEFVLTGESPYEGKEDLDVLPYEDVKSFYDEYRSHCTATDVYPTEIAGKTVFQEAFANEQNIRLTGCKGSFPTCEICNNANDLLRDKGKRYTMEQREIIIKYKAMHLHQQAVERGQMDLLKRRATERDAPFESRVVGVEVICGTIHEVFLYFTDNLVAGGGNIMVEMQRQALIDLSNRLQALGQHMPRDIAFQFDNCGENKCKEMFAYMSMLVETFKFDFIELNFLIVGHTHASIDQFFSGLSKAIG